MKYRFVLLLFWLPAAMLLAEERKPDVYYYSLDITKAENDKIQVVLRTPRIDKQEILFCFPQIVPGTYAIYNFGRFISEFKAWGKSGNELVVEKKDLNCWLIKGSADLDKLSYWVEDTWDTGIREDFIFEPAGTNIESGKNFMINTHGFFGYFEGMKFLKYEIGITRPDNFYGSTGLTNIHSEKNSDVFTINNYVDLVDSPIMYSIPDTAIIQVGGARVLVSVYSPNKVILAKQVADNLRSTLNAQKNYLGGVLPVEKYAFLFYFTDRDTGGSGASGALEHCYSSVYYMPEMPIEVLKQTLTDVTAHEFFHIITPLTIHSEEIGDFSFNSPRMSQHLWLYEGCTEYAAGHVQVKEGLIDRETYLDVIRNKMIGAEEYSKNLSFTEMSRDVLGEYHKEYNNVYQKGALIGMCLDIWLRHYSKGKYGLQELMSELGKMYGKDKSFKDDELFAQIEKMTYPEIGTFFKKYVQGSEPLPFVETFQMAGIDYYPKITVQGISYGGVDIGYNPGTGRLMVVSIEQIDEFGRDLGFLEGDEIISFDGKKLSIDNVKDVITGFIENAKEGKITKVVVMRNSGNKMKKVKLKAKVRKVEISERHILFLSKNANDAQLKVRNSWLGSPK